jgi:bisphosphoglycerate-dependent phosphoglycerate mutase
MIFELIERKILPQTATANSLAIQSTEDIERGRDAIRGIKALLKEIDDTFDPIIAKAHQVHKEAVSQKKRHVEPLEKAKRVIEGKIADYTAMIGREAREAAAKQAEESLKARAKVIEAETRKLEKLCEKATGMQEELDIIEKEFLKPDLTETEEMVLSARRNNLIAKLNQTSDVIVEKQAVIDEKATMVSVPERNEGLLNVKVKGVVSREEKIPEVINPMALVKAVADGRCPITVIDWNMSAIKKLVNAGLVLPGVLITLKKSISIRG